MYNVYVNRNLGGNKMLKKINNFINILMGSFTGAFIGSAISKYLDYKKYKDLYAMQSAP